MKRSSSRFAHAASALASVPPFAALPLFWRMLPSLVFAAGLPCLVAWAGLAYPAALEGSARPVAMGMATLAGLALGVAWLQRHLLQPLRQLQAQASKLADGQDSPTPYPQRKDELGRLGMALHQAGWNQLTLQRDIGSECSGLERVGTHLIDAQHLLLRGLQQQNRLLRGLDGPPEDGMLPAMQALLQSCDAHQASRHLLGQLLPLAQELSGLASGAPGLEAAAQRARDLLNPAERCAMSLQRISQLLGQLRDGGSAERSVSLEQVRQQQAMQAQLMEASLRALDALVRHARQVNQLTQLQRSPSDPQARVAA